MSINHYVKTKKKLDFEQLTDYLADIFPSLQVLRRDKDIYYYWLHGHSTRGMDITREKRRYYEIRNTLLSNEADYQIANLIGRFLTEYYGGKIYDEYEDPLDRQVIFTEEEMEERQTDDVNLLMVLLEHGQEFAFFLANRKVYLGKKAYGALAPYRNDEKTLREKIYARMKYVWYEVPPEFEYGLVMELVPRGKDEKKLIKLITNKTPYIIDKVDYVMFEKGDEPLVIPHEKIYEIKPPSWEMIDEIQFIAPLLPQPEWEALLKRAEPYNVFPDF